jgi:hypothetical protein
MSTDQSPKSTELDLPPLLSIKKVRQLTGLSRATIWRRIQDGSLQIASGSGNGRKALVIGASVQRFMQPKAMATEEVAS